MKYIISKKQLNVIKESSPSIFIARRFDFIQSRLKDRSEVSKWQHCSWDNEDDFANTMIDWVAQDLVGIPSDTYEVPEDLKSQYQKYVSEIKNIFFDYVRSLWECD